MGILKSKYRSELDTQHKKDLLKKIKDGNHHVVFAKGSLRFDGRAAYSLTIDETLGSNNIIYHAPGVIPSAVIQDLTYKAKVPGISPITIAYTTGATAGSEVVTVVGNAISVQIQTGVSTATQIKTKVDAHVTANTMVDVVVSGTGSTAQTAPVSATGLSGLEKYDLADIESINRLRTRKWKVKIKSTANAA
jgi:hypothetical protein